MKTLKERRHHGCSCLFVGRPRARLLARNPIRSHPPYVYGFELVIFFLPQTHPNYRRPRHRLRLCPPCSSRSCAHHGSAFFTLDVRMRYINLAFHGLG